MKILDTLFRIVFPQQYYEYKTQEFLDDVHKDDVASKQLSKVVSGEKNVELVVDGKRYRSR
jgi:hypothetical protein